MPGVLITFSAIYVDAAADEATNVVMRWVK
jgi:hypothetical protein